MSSNDLFNASLAYLAVGRLPTTGVMVTGPAGCGKQNATVELLEKGGCKIEVYDLPTLTDTILPLKEFNEVVQTAKKDKNVLVITTTGHDIDAKNAYDGHILHLIKCGVQEGAKIVFIVTNYNAGSLDASFLNRFIHTEYTSTADISA